MNTVSVRKAQLRAQMLALRAGFDPAAGVRLAAVVLAEVQFAKGARIAGVWPLPGEMDLRPAMAALSARGHEILLPQTPARGEPLIFRAWTPGCAMVQERFGTFRPDGGIGVPDVVFVPLLAFDGFGNRLGYGGGFYDRTLAALPDCDAIGFAYAAQRVASVPTEDFDYPLRIVATETALTHCHPR